MKKIVAVSSIMLFGLMAFTIFQEEGRHLIFETIQKQLTNYNEHYNLEKSYLHLDKPIYKPGERIWLKAYLLDANLQPAQSEIIHIELLNPKGNILQKISLLANDGQAAGDFQLDDNLVGGIYTIKAYTNWQKNTNTFFKKTITIQSVVLPILKMKLDFDKKSYSQGSKGTAKLTIATLKNQPLTKTKITYTIQINGEIIDTKNAKTDKNGVANLAFTLPKNLTSLDGLLNIIIPYLGQKESFSKGIPIVLNDVDIQFFAEGGNFLMNSSNQVAFKAINEFGDPVEIKGNIYNARNEIVTTFEAYHNGMGSCFVRPKRKETYYAKLTSPKGISTKYKLPKVTKKGAIIKLNEIQPRELDVYIEHPENDTLFLVAQSNGTIFHQQKINPLPEQVFTYQGQRVDRPSDMNFSHQIYIPTNKAPIGTAKITIFNQEKQPIAERLVFLNPEKKLNVSIQTDKPTYQNREKVKMDITITDEMNQPVEGNFSLAVTDDNLLTFADDRQGHILANLLLESELKGTITAPNFYFETPKISDKIDRKKALDYLMQTQGWRQYDWKDIQKESFESPKFKVEQKIVEGIVMYFDKSLANVEVEIESLNLKTITDQQGRFTFEGIDLYKPLTIKVKEGKKLIGMHQLVNYNPIIKNVLPKYGKVIEKSSGEALIACIVKIKGTNDEIWTNIDGRFDFVKLFQNHPNWKDLTLVISYTGYNTLEVKMSEINFNNEAIVFELSGSIYVDEVVVTSVRVIRRNRIKKSRKSSREKSRVVQKKRSKTPKKPKTKQTQTLNLDGLAVVLNQAKKSQTANRKDKKPQNNKTNYHKPTQFYTPKYTAKKRPTTRTDFRSTIYWNVNIQTNKDGKASVEFYTSDEVTTFRATLEGVDSKGKIAHKTHLFATILPFSLNVQFPKILVSGDEVNLPIRIENNTNTMMVGALNITTPTTMKLLSKLPEKVKIEANHYKIVLLKYKVNALKKQQEKLAFSFKTNDLEDAIEKPINFMPQGFPLEMVFSGSNKKTAQFDFNINNQIPNTVDLKIEAYPNTLTAVWSGLEAMLRMPSGCFEQTSSSNYPNILVLKYLKATEQIKPKIEAKALAYLEQGYKKLTSFEVTGGGFDWFGQGPAHEGLTAYGLLQFMDMDEIYKVSPKLIQRTAEWLLSRRDGKGSWNMAAHHLHSWNGNEAIRDAYITWAIAETNLASEIRIELDKSYQDAVQSEDPYLMALVANALLRLKDKRAEELLDDLMLRQNPDGSWQGLTYSIVHSRDKGLQIETTALTILAMIKANRKGQALDKAHQFLAKSRNAYGFGNTQSTVLALKAMIEYAIYAKKPPADGFIEILLDGKPVAKKNYTTKTQDGIVFKNLAKNLTDGKHQLTIKYKNNASALPFTAYLSYQTLLPTSQMVNSKPNKKCKLELTTTLSKATAKMSESVRMTVQLNNKSIKAQQNPIAIVGIPSGLQLNFNQLKQYQKEGKFDYYETFNGFLVFYFTRMKSKATVMIPLDLKTLYSGTFTTPASTAFLYYNNEAKTWAKPNLLTVLK